jgi:hypothetical protein
MDEVSSHVRLDLPTTAARSPQRLFRLVFGSHDGRAQCADSVEKHEPASDVSIAAVDSLKALDPNEPIRKADIRVSRPTLQRSHQGIAMTENHRPASLRLELAREH